jgi:hypothetical protein
MSKIINGQANIELSGWWEANIVVSPSYELTQEKYEEHFDKDMVSFDMAESLLENGEELGECLPASCLNGYCIEEIKRAMLENGDDYGVSNDFNDVPDWEFNYLDLTLDGEEADWSNLDDVSKEHIVNCVLEDNCKQGEVCMTESLSYSIDTDVISVEDGVFEGCITINSEECEFTYDKDTDNIEIESGDTVCGEWYDAPIPVEQIPYRCQEIVLAIKEACEDIEHTAYTVEHTLLPSLDEKLDAAESKASDVSGTKDEKAKDAFDR